MFLKELEIIGFKSFGLKSKFNFSEGITCLVGPNGCGKSNVVDALRWVLGEQKTNVLRSDSMDNVIFNGTKTRKPSGLSEVILTIENNKNVLPSEYSEVSVARRLYRNGDSKYLLNKANCRLKDINNLFMDTGMGPDSYSVIELKMVESLLSGRNEDRKNLLEEAAGITKYKVRRKESERKLKSVEEDLERVEDIVSEVRKNVGSLSRQAAKTRRYNKLTEELKELEIVYYALSLGSFKEISSETYSKINKLKANLKELKEKHEAQENDLNKVNSDKQIHQQKVDETRIELSKLSAQKSDLKQKIAVNEIKQKNLERDIARFKEDKEGNLVSIQKKEQRLKELAEEKKKFSEKHNVILRDIDLKNEKINELSSKLESLNTQKQTLDQSINQTQRSIDHLNFKNRQRVENLEKIRNQISEYKTKISDSNANIEKSTSEFESSKNQLSEINKQIDSSNNEYEIQKSEHDRLNQDLNELNRSLRENESETRQKNNELNFWESAVDKESNAGFLQSNKDWNKNYSTLAENLAIDEKYLKAFNSLLGKFANSLFVEEINDILSASELLKSSNKGKQEFLLPTSFNADSNKDLPDGAIDFVSNIPRTNDQIKIYLDSKFQGWVLVDDINDHLNLITDGLCAGIVDTNGSYYSQFGEIYVGGNESVSSNFGKLEKIEKLRSEISDLENSKIELEEKINSVSQNISKIDLSKLRNELSDLESKRRDKNSEISRLEIALNSHKNKVEIFTNNLNNLKNEESNFIESDSELSQIKELEENLESDKNKAEELLKKISDLNSNLEIQKKERSETQISEVNVKNKLSNIKSEEDNLTSSVQFAERRIEQAETDHKNNTSELERSNKETENFIDELDKIQIGYDELSTKTELLSSEMKQKELEAQNISRELKITSDDLNKLTNEEHKYEIELTEINTKVENIIRNAQEKYEISSEDLLSLNPDGETDEIRPKVEEIKEKLSGIGNINFMALEEYEKENERLIFYETQIEDLNSAKSTLIQTITEINTTAETQLLETFTKVRANFKDLFNTLFNEEGECDITLEGENPLEADLKIMAKPPGKKPHSIDMLSGGEKTLTAIALLFAIYLVKPSPFCILDEVDAPLDDNNIGRFVNLIKKFSNNTQFIVVTHNKKTMEAADNLYGITQQEQGLSRIVSVELGKQTQNQDTLLED